MRKILYLLLVVMTVSVSPLVRAQTERDISGTYWVQGTNPGGKGSYQGIATVVKTGDAYRVHWEVGTVYQGVGKLKGNTFQVEWGTSKENVGTVTYQLQPDGSLKGTWYVAKNPESLGTETLSPKRK